MSITTDESDHRDARAWLENFVAVTAGWSMPPGASSARNKDGDVLGFYLHPTAYRVAWRTEVRLTAVVVEHGDFGTPLAALAWMEEQHASPMGDDE